MMPVKEFKADYVQQNRWSPLMPKLTSGMEIFHQIYGKCLLVPAGTTFTVLAFLSKLRSLTNDVTLLRESRKQNIDLGK